MPLLPVNAGLEKRKEKIKGWKEGKIGDPNVGYRSTPLDTMIFGFKAELPFCFSIVDR